MRQTTTLYRYLAGTDEAAFGQMVTDALRRGWILYGAPSLAYDAKAGQVVLGQAVTKDVDVAAYDPGRDLSSY